MADSTADFMRLASQQISTLRDELHLAEAELAEKRKRAGLGAGLFGPEEDAMTDPKTPEEPAAEIELTRESLGDAVVHKTVEATKVVADKAVETAKKAADKTAEATKEVADKAVETAKKAADKTAEVSKTAAEDLAVLAGQGVAKVRRNPLPAIIAGLAALVAVVLARARKRRR